MWRLHDERSPIRRALAGATEITLRVYIPPGRAALAKLQMVDACREIVPYSQTLLSDIAFDAYFTGHEAGSRHA